MESSGDGACTNRFVKSCSAQDEPGRVGQAKEQSHQGNARHLRPEPGGETFLNDGPEKEFLDQADLEEEPGKAEREADRQLARH